MGGAFVQHALLEEKRVGAPKKARKLMFTDPFVFHAVRAWLQSSENPHVQQVLPLLSDPRWAGRLAEATLATHYRQHYPTYYIKSAREVDLAYVDQNRFWPVELKWTGQLRPKDLKQIRKYDNSKILSRSPQLGMIHDIPSESLALALFRLGLLERPERIP